MVYTTTTATKKDKKLKSKPTYEIERNNQVMNKEKQKTNADKTNIRKTQTTTNNVKRPTKEMKTYIHKKETNVMKIGTWNIRSIQGKERELEEEFERAKLDILAINETKKKGKGSIKLENGNVLIFSGTEKKKRASAGVGCIIHKKLETKIEKWKAITERILKITLKNINNEYKTIIIVYAPNEDDTVANKEKFWDELTEITEDAKGKIIIAGDFNSRVGKKDHKYYKEIGTHGEDKRNDNGKRMLQFCKMQNMIITNTFFKHKDIHKITREVRSRNERSIIDYILVEEKDRKLVIDTKVRRGPEIGSDHYMVVSKIRDSNNIDERQNTVLKNKIKFETIRAYKLQNEETSKKYSSLLTKRLQEDTKRMKNVNVEEMWVTFRNTIIDTARTTCGSNRKINSKRQTAWWSEEIKNKIKLKKIAWGNYLREKNTNR